jgi:hypothetical protein
VQTPTGAVSNDVGIAGGVVLQGLDVNGLSSEINDGVGRMTAAEDDEVKSHSSRPAASIIAKLIPSTPGAPAFARARS